MALADTRWFGSEGPLSVHVYRTASIGTSVGRKRANGVGVGKRVGGGGDVERNGAKSGNGDVNVYGDRYEEGRRTEV